MRQLAKSGLTGFYCDILWLSMTENVYYRFYTVEKLKGSQNLNGKTIKIIKHEKISTISTYTEKTDLTFKTSKNIFISWYNPFTGNLISVYLWVKLLHSPPGFNRRTLQCVWTPLTECLQCVKSHTSFTDFYSVCVLQPPCSTSY